MYTWDDFKKYKPCTKKKYQIWACQLPKGSIFANKLEQSDTVKLMNNISSINAMKAGIYHGSCLADGFRDLSFSHAQIIPKLVEGMWVNPIWGFGGSGGCADVFDWMVSELSKYGVPFYTADPKTCPICLCGTTGEFWGISLQKFCSTYAFLSDGYQVPINEMTFKQRSLKAIEWNNDSGEAPERLPWTRVETITGSKCAKLYAVFVPSNQVGKIQTSWGAVLDINKPGIQHGKGDFVICSSFPNGSPNFNDRWVVNGLVFRDTYNNRGWEDVISSVNSSGVSAAIKEPFNYNKVLVDC